MFGIDERDRLRDALIATARADERITGAALTGSGSVDATDAWSDIDLALGIAGGVDPAEVMADWTTLMYGEHGAVHHMDVLRGTVVYRVFLLASTLQVDVAFARAAEFGATAPTFRLLFGTASDLAPPREPDRAALVDMGWLYALHARSSIARGRVWQAEHMINGMRGQIIALTCLRHGLPGHDGRGTDRLPPDVTGRITRSLVRSLDVDELARAFRVATELLLTEIRLLDPDLALRLDAPLRELAPDPPRTPHRAGSSS